MYSCVFMDLRFCTQILIFSTAHYTCTFAHIAFSKISTNILHNIQNDAIATAAATAVESMKAQCSLRYLVEIKQAPIVCGVNQWKCDSELISTVIDDDKDT